jgi:ATP-binding cassette subfamily B protein
MLASGIAELVSLGAVLPFLAVLSDPERLWQQPFIHEIAVKTGLTQPSQLILPTTVAFATAAFLSAAVRLTNLWLLGRLAAAVSSDLSCEAYRRTLLQPYAIHLQRNSSDVINAIRNQVVRTAYSLTGFLQMVTAGVVAIALLIGLLLIDWRVATGAAALFGSLCFFLGISAKKQLTKDSRSIAAASAQQLKALQEGLGAIRDILLNHSQATYLEIYRKADRSYQLLDARTQFMGTFPRYILEGIGMMSIALLGGLLTLNGGSGVVVVPLLGALALGAQRLLPALQQVYTGWASAQRYSADLAGVLMMLKQPVPQQIESTKQLELKHTICFQDVQFRYHDETPDVIIGLNLVIHQGERIGLIGSTGSGKSTTVDLLMGLLRPTSGKILVDGQDLHDSQNPSRLSEWRATIAHVPQSIFLADSSIAENIAFGLPKQEIDLMRVKYAAEQAQIASFIESRPEGYESLVGERGIQLSGGQRQRIGIARALYRKASVLVFDEATSALDNETEKAVMESIDALSKDLTIVIIAHRLSTLHSCDRIIMMHLGSVSTYDSSSIHL